MHVTKPSELLWLGDLNGPKPYKFIGFRWAFMSQTPVACMICSVRAFFKSHVLCESMVTIERASRHQAVAVLANVHFVGLSGSLTYEPPGPAELCVFVELPGVLGQRAPGPHIDVYIV